MSTRCRVLFFLVCAFLVVSTTMRTASLSGTLDERMVKNGKLPTQDAGPRVVQWPHSAGFRTTSTLVVRCLVNQSECDFPASGEGWFEQAIARWSEHSQVQVVSSVRGLRSCGIDHAQRDANRSVVTVLLQGHLRTFQTVQKDLQRFLTDQPVDVDTIIVPWETIWSRNDTTTSTTSHLAASNPERPGLPLVLAGIHSWADRHPGRVTHAVLNQSSLPLDHLECQKYLVAAAYHLLHLCLGRNRSPYDVVVKTRPDLIYSHRVDFVALRRFFQSHPLAAFCITHQDKGTFRYDPVEFTWLTSVQGTHRMYQYSHGDRLCPETQKRNSVLGFYYSSLLTHCAQLDILYIRLDFAIRLVHHNSRFSGTLPRGHESFFATGGGLLDITREVVCVRPRLNEKERCLKIYGIPCCGKISGYPNP